jgi:predicted O-methyltransferase YrrM
MKGKTMTQDQWTAVEDYMNKNLIPADPGMDAVLAASTQGGLPEISVAAHEGKFLWLMATMRGARRILEVGTLGGYSTIWLARALPADGCLVTLEADPTHHAVARENIRAAGFADQVDCRLGLAADTMAQLVEEGAEAFDLIFIDADKPGYPTYFEWALKLSRKGTVIIADNVVRYGDVVDENKNDAGILGIRQLMALAAAEPRVSGVTLQTVGSKGYDGMAILVVAE